MKESIILRDNGSHPAVTHELPELSLSPALIVRLTVIATGTILISVITVCAYLAGMMLGLLGLIAFLGFLGIMAEGMK